MLEMMMGGNTGGGSNGSDNNTLLAGTLTKGWYGEVSASNFITGDALASTIGLTAGTSVNSDAGWLKFSLDSKTLYVAKRPFRYGLSWDQINAVGAVTGTKNIVISGKTYKVRLLKGRGDGLTTTFTAGFDTTPTVNSEWNRTMYHISGKPFSYANNTLASEGISEGDWAKYSEADLWVCNNVTYGYSNWCQDYVTSGGNNYILVRGIRGVSYVSNQVGSGVANSNGWRPCLELVG